MFRSQPKGYWGMMVPQLIIAIIFCLVFAGTVFFTFTSDINMWTETQEKVAMVLLGILSAGLMTILNYFFSSSLGSKIKTLTPPEKS